MAPKKKDEVIDNVAPIKPKQNSDDETSDDDSVDDSIEESEYSEPDLNNVEYDEDGNIIEQDEEVEGADAGEEDGEDVDDDIADVDEDGAEGDGDGEGDDIDDDKKDDGNLDLGECVIDDNDDVLLAEYIEVLKEDRRTMPTLTKFERVKIIGKRTTQLSEGAPPLIKNVNNKSPLEIATIELQMKMIPFKIKRYLPNRTYEIWKISELNSSV